jgi:hypothetical protein
MAVHSKSLSEPKKKDFDKILPDLTTILAGARERPDALILGDFNVPHPGVADQGTAPFGAGVDCTDFGRRSVPGALKHHTQTPLFSSTLAQHNSRGTLLSQIIAQRTHL